MTERYVPVATYHLLQDGQIAANLLESHGIKAMVEGFETSSAFSGLIGMGDQVRVLVPEEDASRATTLLAEIEAGELDDDWEDEAESMPTCSLCGENLAEADTMCAACQTPRDAIRSKAPRMDKPSKSEDGIRSDEQRRGTQEGQ